MYDYAMNLSSFVEKFMLCELLFSTVFSMCHFFIHMRWYQCSLFYSMTMFSESGWKYLKAEARFFKGLSISTSATSSGVTLWGLNSIIGETFVRAVPFHPAKSWKLHISSCAFITHCNWQIILRDEWAHMLSSFLCNAGPQKQKFLCSWKFSSSFRKIFIFIITDLLCFKFKLKF